MVTDKKLSILVISEERNESHHMYTYHDLVRDLENLKIDPKGTILVHSSMKSIGPVEGGADTVLDALMDYMKDGLLVLLDSVIEN